LDGVVPQPWRTRIPQDGAAIVETLLAQWSTKFGVILRMSPRARNEPAVDAMRLQGSGSCDATSAISNGVDGAE
jgi:hypothetical protein